MSCLSLLLWHPLQLQHQLLLELPLHLQELLPLPIHLSLLVFQNLYFLALKRKQNCSYYWDEDYLGWGFFFARAWPNTLRTSWLSFAITIVSRGFSSASSSAAVSLLRLRWLLLSVCVSLIKIEISSWALWKWQCVVSFREPAHIYVLPWMVCIAGSCNSSLLFRTEVNDQIHFCLFLIYDELSNCLLFAIFMQQPWLWLYYTFKKEKTTTKTSKEKDLVFPKCGS